MVSGENKDEKSGKRLSPVIWKRFCYGREICGRLQGLGSVLLLGWSHKVIIKYFFIILVILSVMPYVILCSLKIINEKKVKEASIPALSQMEQIPSELRIEGLVLVLNDIFPPCSPSYLPVCTFQVVVLMVDPIASEHLHDSHWWSPWNILGPITSAGIDQLLVLIAIAVDNRNSNIFNSSRYNGDGYELKLHAWETITNSIVDHKILTTIVKNNTVHVKKWTS